MSMRWRCWRTGWPTWRALMPSSCWCGWRRTSSLSDGHALPGWMWRACWKRSGRGTSAPPPPPSKAAMSTPCAPGCWRSWRRWCAPRHRARPDVLAGTPFPDATLRLPAGYWRATDRRPAGGGGGQPVGVISRRDVDRAIHHRLSHAGARVHVARRAAGLPDAPLHEIEHLMIEERVGRIPVMHEGRLVGIITRTDVLRALHQAAPTFLPPRPTAGPAPGGAPRQRRRPAERAPSRACPAAAGPGRRRRRALHLYVFTVGGFVRDLLLGVANLDVDLVVRATALPSPGAWPTNCTPTCRCTTASARRR